MVLRAPAVAVRPTSLLGLVLLLAGTVQALQPDEVGMSAISPATPDYLKPLDSNFVGQYENLKTLETLSHPFVVLASTDEQRIYRYGNFSLSVPVDTAMYHAMKTYLHSTLGLYGTCRVWALGGAGGEPALNEAEKQDGLSSFLDAAAAAVELSSSDPNLNAEQREAVAQITKEYVRLVEQAAADGFNATACVQGMRSQKDAVMALVTEAAEAHWNNLQAAISKVKEEATDEEWAQVLVAVPTGATPQKLNIEYGAWLHAIGGEPESRQVFSAVGVFDDAGILAALATKVTDSELSADFFQNRTRMWYDLLGDVAEAHVGRIYSGF